jgi:ribosomal protein S6
VKKYEGLFILNTAGKEEGSKDVVDKISADINAAGGRIETVQKMDKKSFSRVRNKKASSGFYVNIIFEILPSAIAALRARFAMNDDVFRVLFTEAPKPKEAAPAQQ